MRLSARARARQLVSLSARGQENVRRRVFASRRARESLLSLFRLSCALVERAGASQALFLHTRGDFLREGEKESEYALDLSALRRNFAAYARNGSARV